MRRIIIAVVVAGAALAGCSSSHPLRHLQAKLTCADQVHAWYRHDMGRAEIIALGHAVKGVGEADRAAGQAHLSKASLTGIARATDKLNGAITTLSGNLPPGCATGVRAKVIAGLSEFSQAAIAQNAAVGKGKRGDSAGTVHELQVSEGHAKAGAADFAAGGKALLHFARH